MADIIKITFDDICKVLNNFDNFKPINRKNRRKRKKKIAGLNDNGK